MLGTHTIFRFMPRAAAALLLLTMLAMPGCGTVSFGDGGSLTAESQRPEDRRVLASDFEHAVYAYDTKDTLTIVLYSGSADRPTQAAVVRMFWMPQAGTTPVDPTATNANVHYVVFAGGQDQAQTQTRDASTAEGESTADGTDGDGTAGAAPPRQVGVYSGAGFLYPKTDPPQASLPFELWEASIQLADRSAGFEDLLGQAVLEGDFAAYQNANKVNRLLHTINKTVNATLGYPRLIQTPIQPGTGRLASAVTAPSAAQPGPGEPDI